MTRYKYRIVTYPEAELYRFPSDYNGTDWELVAVIPLTDDGQCNATRCFFKRVMTDERAVAEEGE